MNTLARLNKIAKQHSRPKFYAEFVKATPILTLRAAILDYAKTYDDAEAGAELRTALRDKVAANTSVLFNNEFANAADVIDGYDVKKEQI